MRHSWKRWFVIAVLLALLVVIAVSRMRRPEHVRLRDGTVLAITAVKLGDTNIFTHGSWAQHFFSRKLKLEPHTTAILARVAIVPDLAFEFTVKPTMEK